VDQVAVLRELFAESNSEMANVLAAVPQDIAGQILQLADNVFRTDDLDTFGPLIVSRYNAQPQGQQAPITIEDIRPDPAWAFMQRDLEQTWRNGAAQRLGARAFVKSSDRGLNSYDPAALGRKVSNYQFRSASEWFAEAYAAHFDPTEERGALLVAAGDRPTRNLIATL
jgi:hypothetical protein